MSNTVHYADGCVWASGDIQQADTDTTFDWKKVTCKHCLNKKRGTKVMSDEAYYKKYVLPLIRRGT